MKKVYTWEDMYDMYKSSEYDESIYEIILQMSKSEIEEIMADAQKHDLVGTYSMIGWLESMLDYVCEKE